MTIPKALKVPTHPAERPVKNPNQKPANFNIIGSFE
jgi:hypothetical protein